MRQPLTEWRILNQGNYCENPEACLTKRKQDLMQIKQQEEPALIEAAEVQPELDRLLTRPNAPIIGNNAESIFGRIRKLANFQSNGYDITRTNTVLFRLRDIELRVAAEKRNWQWQAANAYTTAKNTLDTLPTFLDDIRKEMTPGFVTNIEQDSEHAFTNLSKVKYRLNLNKASIQQAQNLDPRLKQAGDEGMKAASAYEQDAANKVEQICSIYLSPHPLGMSFFKFNSGYGAFNWCKAHPNNRWAQYSVISG
jgi:hypothetical protein